MPYRLALTSRYGCVSQLPGLSGPWFVSLVELRRSPPCTFCHVFLANVSFVGNLLDSESRQPIDDGNHAVLCKVYRDGSVGLWKFPFTVLFFFFFSSLFLSFFKVKKKFKKRSGRCRRTWPSPLQKCTSRLVIILVSFR